MFKTLLSAVTVIGLLTGTASAELPAASTGTIGNSRPTTDNEIALEKHGGTYKVPVSINRSISLNFILDSGASEVFIPADVFLTLLRTNTVSRSDFLDSKIYSLADGSKLTGARFIIRELKVGNQTATDVVATVGPVSGELLLGLSFLSKFGIVILDNERHVLTLSKRNGVPVLTSPQRHDETAAITLPTNPKVKNVAFSGFLAI